MSFFFNGRRGLVFCIQLDLFFFFVFFCFASHLIGQVPIGDDEQECGFIHFMVEGGIWSGSIESSWVSMPHF
jgi:hypothetical protein